MTFGTSKLGWNGQRLPWQTSSPRSSFCVTLCVPFLILASGVGPAQKTTLCVSCAHCHCSY